MRADLPGEVTTLPSTTTINASKDGDELRMYKITAGKNNKVKVKLIASKILKWMGCHYTISS